MTGRKPRKYADRGRTTLTPEFLEWQEEERRRYLATAGFMFGHPSTFWPEQYDKDLGEGAWILVVEVPHTALEWDVPLLSMWRARPHRMQSGGIPAQPNLGLHEGIRPYQAVIATPAGDLHLWPHEYMLVSDPAGLAGEDGATIHTLGGEPLVDEDQWFYLRSRGIPGPEAARMLLATSSAFDYAYVTFPDEVVEALAGAGVPLWRHIQMHPRGQRADEAS